VVKHPLCCSFCKLPITGERAIAHAQHPCFFSSTNYAQSNKHKLGTELGHSCLCLFCAKHKKAQNKHRIGTKQAQRRHICAFFVPGTKLAQLFMSQKSEHKSGTKVAQKRHRISTTYKEVWSYSWAQKRHKRSTT
jgi:hypothetical protein